MTQKKVVEAREKRRKHGGLVWAILLIASAVNRPARGLRVEQASDVKDGVAQYELHVRGSSGPFSFFDLSDEDFLWDLQLNREVPKHLTVSTGVGESHLNLRQLNLRDGAIYVSPCYDDALDRIDLDIDARIGQVIVRTYSGR